MLIVEAPCSWDKNSAAIFVLLFSWNWSLESRFYATWSRIHCRYRLYSHGPQHHQTLISWFHVLMFQLYFPLFFQFGKKHGRKIVQGNCIYSVWLFFIKPIFQARVWLGKNCTKVMAFFQDCHFIFPPFLDCFSDLEITITCSNKATGKTWRVMWNKR